MKALIAALVLGATAAVPVVRTRLLRLLARTGRGTTVRVVPGPEHR